jgi:hypothetical protein
MLDIPEMLIIGLTALTVVVWTHSWIHDRREMRVNQPDEVDAELVQN